MFFENINYIMAVSAIVAMGLGFIWYSPFLFGKRFMKETGMDQANMEEWKKNGGQQKMAKTYAITFVLALLSAFVLSALLNSLFISSIWQLVVVAFFVWLAFNMPVSANHVMFGKDTIALFAINTGYQLVSTVLMALIIGIFG
jgi:hypothetical protein